MKLERKSLYRAACAAELIDSFLTRFFASQWVTTAPTVSVYLLFVHKTTHEFIAMRKKS
jgi:hypothetical protein